MHDREVQALQQAMAALQAQRAALGDVVLDAALAPLRARLAALQPQPQPPDARPAPDLPPSQPPARQRRQASILFLDLVGSTQLIGQLDLEDAQAVVDGALAAFSALVRQHHGEVLRYAGDSLKAAFGADKAAPDHAECAVACGLALLDEARRRGRAVQQAHGLAGFDARVGIHTGAVVRGGGVELHSSLSGLAVHVAARMEQAAAPGTLRISMDTYRQVQGLVQAQEQAPLAVKGLHGPMRTFVVQAMQARRLRGPRHGTEGVTAAMVGRDTELAALCAAAAALGRPGAALHGITLLGEAGLGKSRLLDEFRVSLQAQRPAGLPTAQVWQASSHPHQGGQPYGLLRDLLFSQLGVQDSQSQAEAQHSFAAALQPVLGAGADEQVAMLGQLIGLDYSASPFVAGIARDSAQLRARGLNAWQRCLAQHAARQPLVLLLDDLHWADDASLDALDHLASQGAAMPALLLVCAARPQLLERRAHWAQDWPRHRRLPLTPLAAPQGRALADALLGRLAAPHTGLSALLVGQAAGNPFYMEALLQMLMDTGAARATPEGWTLRADALQGRHLPGTLVGVLQATLDALAPRELRCLQLASVVGARFWDQALAAIEPAAVDQLPMLHRKELALLQPHSAFAASKEYSFRHHLLHQVSYDTVLQADRRLGHAQAARWLLARGQGREGELASQVAEHLERAGEPALAAPHWLRAAEDAAQREADVAALQHTGRALALADALDLRQRLRLHRVRADVHRRQGHAGAHLHEIGQMETLAESIGDDVLRLAVAFDRVWRLCLDARFADAAALARQRLDGAPNGAPGDAARLHGQAYLALARLGRMPEAMAHAEQGLALARAAGEPATVGQIHTYVGVLAMEAEELDSALHHHHQARAAYQAAGSRSGLVAVHINLAHAQATLGRVAEARDLLLQAIADSRETGNRRMEAIAQANIGGQWFELGDAQAAYAASLEGLRLAALAGETRTAAWAHNSAQYAAFGLGRFAQALQHARQAEAGFRAHAVLPAAWLNAAAAARNLLALGCSQDALAAAEALLLEVDAAEGWHGAFELAYALHQVLAPLGHARAAALLQAAHHALCAQAERLAAHIPRDVFLRGLSIHRAICALWAASPAGAAAAMRAPGGVPMQRAGPA